jgi:exodeoxyribonuclease VII small subunit
MPKARPSESSASGTAPGNAKPAHELSFEAALVRLEQVVDRLEQGDLELEASLEAFEEGVRLSRRCASQLDAAEQRIEVLMREGAGWLARPFESDGASDPDEGADGVGEAEGRG